MSTINNLFKPYAFYLELNREADRKFPQWHILHTGQRCRLRSVYPHTRVRYTVDLFHATWVLQEAHNIEIRIQARWKGEIASSPGPTHTAFYNRTLLKLFGKWDRITEASSVIVSLGKLLQYRGNTNSTFRDIYKFWSSELRLGTWEK